MNAYRGISRGMQVIACFRVSPSFMAGTGEPPIRCVFSSAFIVIIGSYPLIYGNQTIWFLYMRGYVFFILCPKTDKGEKNNGKENRQY